MLRYFTGQKIISCCFPCWWVPYRKTMLIKMLSQQIVLGNQLITFVQPGPNRPPFNKHEACQRTTEDWVFEGLFSHLMACFSKPENWSGGVSVAFMLMDPLVFRAHPSLLGHLPISDTICKITSWRGSKSFHLFCLWRRFSAWMKTQTSSVCLQLFC